MTESKKSSLKILLVENLAKDAELILGEIKGTQKDVILERVDSAEAMKHAISTQSWDIVLSDYNIPDFDAFQTLEFLKKSKQNIPFIVISDAMDEETAVEILKAGADDVVLKSKLSRLMPAIKRSLREHHGQRLAEKAQSDREHLLAVVSHDLKNPLGGVSLNLQIALAKLDQSEKTGGTIKSEILRPILERAQRSSQRMLGLIQGILDQTNIQAGHLALNKKKSSTSLLMQELSELFKPLAEKAAIIFEIREEEHECVFLFDFERIFQTLGNLVSNAIKFTPEGGKITVWYESSPTEVKFFVRDTGSGISEGERPLVFKRFWQGQRTSGQGLGLGLSICRGIVEGHGGSIHVISTEGEGSTFSFTLPREKESVSTAPSPGAHKILIVDDDTSLADAFAEALRGRGHETICANSAEEGLKICAKVSSGLSLIVVDYQLPGMNGGEFVSALRKMGSQQEKIPVVLASADADLSVKAATLAINGFLSKPADLDRFVNMIEGLLHTTSSALLAIPSKSLTNYCRRRAEDLENCEQALEKADYEMLRSVSHRIKGSAATFGFPELSTIAQELETAVFQTNPGNIKAAMNSFKSWVEKHAPAAGP